MNKTLTFNECEHKGDLDNYMDDIRRAGGKIHSSVMDYSAEMGIVHVEIDDEDVFKEKFSITESFEFCETYY